jgi:hypothetical protein
MIVQRAGSVVRQPVNISIPKNLPADSEEGFQNGAIRMHILLQSIAER